MNEHETLIKLMAAYLAGKLVVFGAVPKPRNDQEKLALMNAIADDFAHFVEVVGARLNTEVKVNTASGAHSGTVN